MGTLRDQIDEKIGEIRTDTLDISFGEMMSLYEANEFIIQPDYQRLFRWSPEQQSRLMESILLELPVPQIFTIEDEDGVLELIDGLQRICSVIHFVDYQLLGEMEHVKGPLELGGCELLPALDGASYEDLELALKLRTKRSSVRMVIVKGYGNPRLKYEMFKRLNTGGSLLSYQEIRNCTARMMGQPGIEFYRFLIECAQEVPFAECTETMSDAGREEKGDEELVLRFFACKNALDRFKGDVRDWLDGYMDDIIFGKVDFDYDAERAAFKSVFGLLKRAIGTGAFVRYSEDKALGGLKPAYFEAVATGAWRTFEGLKETPNTEIEKAIVSAVQSSEFSRVTGPGANTKPKLSRRIEIVETALQAVQ